MLNDELLLELLEYLKREDYEFVAVTPATHAHVVARPSRGAPTLRDLFGWNRSFQKSDVEPQLLGLMNSAGILKADNGGFRSALRAASLGQDLFLHSAYPTDEVEAVFFGPDTYRFARFIAKQLPALSPMEVVDMGTGTGAGGIVVGRLAPSASITLVDTNAKALDLARVNAKAAGVSVDLILGNALPPMSDIVVANPPYMMDEHSRSYRDGGSLFGGEIALSWVRDALGKLVPGGVLLLYTGVAVVDGAAPLIGELHDLCHQSGASISVEELDPDVFGEELARPDYSAVERIAAVGLVIRTAT